MDAHWVTTLLTDTASLHRPRGRRRTRADEVEQVRLGLDSPTVADFVVLDQRHRPVNHRGRVVVHVNGVLAVPAADDLQQQDPEVEHVTIGAQIPGAR